MQNMKISTAAEDQDIDVIHRFLSEESPWAKGISRPLVQECIRNSLNFGLFVENAQVGYARVISDYASFAYLLDVFVLPEYRGRGYSRQIMDAVITHPRLQGLRRFILVSSTARGLYQKYGFASLAKPEMFMEINVPNAYQNGA